MSKELDGRKKMRFEETRSWETREVEINYDDVLRNIQQGNLSTVTIPPERIPQGWVYAWARDTHFKSGEHPDHTRMPNLLRKGWTPVPAENHPELVPPDVLGRNAHMRGYIYRDGSILCQRPKHIHDAETAKQMQESNRSLDYVRQFGAKVSPDPRYVGPLRAEASVTRGTTID